MPSRFAPPRVILPLLAGMLLAALPGWLSGHWSGAAAALVAGISLWLAQVGIARGVAGLRGELPALRTVVPGVLLVWAAGLLGAASLLIWPLQAALAQATLGSTLALSAAAGIGLLLLWALWPLWQAAERDGGRLREHWTALRTLDAGSWRGLGAALSIAAALAGVLIAWPGVLADAWRIPVALGYALALPALHWALQSIEPPSPRRVSPHFADLPMTEAPLVLPTHASAGETDAALYAAARVGRVEQAFQLLEAGADPLAMPPVGDRDQRPLPALAAVLPDLRLLRALIARGVDLNAAHAGVTPLLAATRDSWHGRPDAVMTLLANGADARAADAQGNTPLHHAARSSDPGVAALLRDAAAEIDALNDEGETPLAIACGAGNWRLARFLLERGARADHALRSAAAGEEDDPAGIQLLLRHKAPVDARDGQGRGALHEAALAGHAEIAGALLAAGADPQAVDAEGLTPWLDAARGGHLPVLERLLDARPQPTAGALAATDHAGRDALILAAAAPQASAPLIERLLGLGLDPQRRDASGRRAADHAAAAGRWSLVTLLDPAYALPAAVLDGENDAGIALNALDLAAAAPAERVLPDRPPLDLLREAVPTAAHAQLAALAALTAPDELSALLLDPELDPAGLGWLLANAGIDAAAAEAALWQHLERGPSGWPPLRALLDAGVAPTGRGGLARFLAAALAHRGGPEGEPLALDLLQRGADAMATTSTGDPAIALAVRLDWTRALDALLALGVDPDARDARGMTALHLAAALSRESAVQRLIAHGAAADARAADGQTPLGAALATGRREVAQWLDWRGWEPPARPLRGADLPAAAIMGDAEAVRRLLALGLPVDAADAQGCTALLRAAGGGHRDTVDRLLDAGANPQHAARTGATPLSAAISSRQGEIVDRLLRAGAGLDQRLPGGVTVLMLAAALGLPDLTARLLRAGADIEADDAQGLAPLHCAALYGFTARDQPRLVALLDTLLLAGAPPDQAATGGLTPLLLLLGARAEAGTAADEEVVLAGLERLFDESVALQVQDSRGFGPLHLAALHGLARVVRRLLRAGADPVLRDALGRTPSEVALMRGFIDVAGEFGPVRSGVTVARLLREPR